MSDSDIGVEETSWQDKTRRVLENAVANLPLADRIELAAHPGIEMHIVGNSIEYRTANTGQLLAVVDRQWLTDDTDSSWHPEFVATDDTFDLPDDLRS